MAVVAMVLGFIWFGPLFGKRWGKVIGSNFDSMSAEQKKAMQKKMGPVYILAFLLNILTFCVLSRFMQSPNALLGNGSSMSIAFYAWLGLVMPIIASSAMWSGRPRKHAWEMFFLSAGYNLVLFLIAGWVLAKW